jgi:hypothetical protein
MSDKAIHAETGGAHREEKRDRERPSLGTHDPVPWQRRQGRSCVLALVLVKPGP